MSTMRDAISLPENLTLTTPDRSSFPATSYSTPPSHQSIVGFLRSLFESITASICSTLRSSRLPCLPPPGSYCLRLEPVYPLIKKIYQHTLFNLHGVQENLQYWTTTGMQHPETETVLKTIGRSLTIFASQLYVEVEVFEEQNSTLASLLGAINCFYLQLQESVRPINEICTICPLSFEELPGRDENIESGQNYYDIRDANFIHSNLDKLDLYLSLVIDKYRKPNKIIHHRMRYTFGLVGISLLSVWLLRRSGVVLQAKESIKWFFSYHVEQPLTTIRDGLSNTRELEMALKKFQFGSNDLHSFEKNISQLIGNLIKDRYFGRSVLIQLQQLNDDINAKLCEMKHHMAMVDEMRSAIFAVLPTFFISIGALMISQVVIQQNTMGRRKISSIAYEQRRLLINEVEDRIMELQNSNMLPPQTQDAHYINGMVLYTLDRLYRDAEGDAKAFGEWYILQEEIFVLGNTKLETEYKLGIISGLRRYYNCLYPRTTTWSLNDLTERRFLGGNVSNREANRSERESTS